MIELPLLKHLKLQKCEEFALRSFVNLTPAQDTSVLQNQNNCLFQDDDYSPLSSILWFTLDLN
jgi:hypothetical protein